MPRILVTGANGQLGQELAFLADFFPELDLVFFTRHQLDISQSAVVHSFFAEKKWDFCINCAAYTAVDQAESEEAPAMAINRDGAKNLAIACSQHGVKLIHFSTDFVYHNQCNRPLLETDPTEPKSVYARTKLAGEELVREILPAAIIWRTSWVYSSFGNNFVKTMLRLGPQKGQLRVVDDQVGTPTYARDLAMACLQIVHESVNQEAAWQGGTYNFSNEGVCSWYDFAQAIFEMSGIKCEVIPIESKDYPSPAQRPHYSVLNKHKFKNTFGQEIDYWRNSLQQCLEIIVNPEKA